MAGPNETAFGFALSVVKALADILLRSSMISHDSSRFSLCIYLSKFHLPIVTMGPTRVMAVVGRSTTAR